MLIQHIIIEIAQQQNKQNVLEVLEKMVDMKEEIHQDDLNDSMDFL